MFTHLFGNHTPPLRVDGNPDRNKVNPARIPGNPLCFLLLHHPHLIIIAIMVLLPPRNDDYVTLEELVNAVQAHASKEGYAIVKGRSKSIKGNGGFNNKINLYCDRGGQPRKPPNVTPPALSM